MSFASLRCPHDGGFCHHRCGRDCFRLMTQCALTTPWPGFPVLGILPVRMSCKCGMAEEGFPAICDRYEMDDTDGDCLTCGHEQKCHTKESVNPDWKCPFCGWEFADFDKERHLSEYHHEQRAVCAGVGNE